MIDQVDNLPPPPSNVAEVARDNLLRFLKPLGENSKPGTTGMAAIKKEGLHEHGPTSLSEQQQQNIKAGQ